MAARLKAGIWVSALLRQSMAQGIMATQIRRGDADAGAVLIKYNLRGPGFRVLSAVNDPQGERAWMAVTGPEPVDEAKADAYIARAVDRDSDLWVVEIEDPQGRPPLGERIID